MEPDETTVVDVVKHESAKQMVILVFGIAGTVSAVYLERKLRDTDTVKLWKMWSALTVKRWADRWSERFARLASHMATVYNGEKL